MNSYERVFARLEGRKVDRIPNTCLVMTFAARQIGVPYGKYVSDYKLLSQGVLHCYEKFHQDMLCVISDPMREAQALGANVIIPEDDVPYCKEMLVNTAEDICKLKPVKPEDSPRTYDRLEAVRFLSDTIKKEAPVVGWVEGSVAEACDLTGVSEFMMMMLDEPEMAHQLLEVCLEQSRLFALGQIAAGAQIIGVGDAATSLIGPDLYEEFALPYQKRLIEEIHKAGAKVKLHICGNLNPVLESIAQTGADIVDLDYMVDMENAVNIFGNSLSVCGNFDPVSVLLQGQAEDIRNEVKRCAAFSNKNSMFISAGCEIPKYTPDENVMAIYEQLLEL